MEVVEIDGVHLEFPRFAIAQEETLPTDVHPEHAKTCFPASSAFIVSEGERGARGGRENA